LCAIGEFWIVNESAMSAWMPTMPLSAAVTVGQVALGEAQALRGR
jgi:hypothetical protein